MGIGYPRTGSSCARGLEKLGFFFSSLLFSTRRECTCLSSKTVHESRPSKRANRADRVRTVDRYERQSTEGLPLSFPQVGLYVNRSLQNVIDFKQYAWLTSRVTIGCY